MYKTTSFLRLTLLIMTIICNAGIVNSQIQNVALTNTTINAISDYTFQIYDPSFNGSYTSQIILGLPSELSPLPSPLSCYDNNINASLNCTVQGLNVIISQTNANIRGVVIITLTSIKNPSSQISLNFSYIASNSSTSQPTNFASFSLLTADSLINCSVVFTPSQVNVFSTATINITIKNDVDVNGQIAVVFPSLWYNSLSQNSTTLLPNATCSTVNGPLISQPKCTLTPQILLMQNSFTSPLSPNTSISFNISGVITPPTTYPYDQINISTQSSDQNYIDSCNCSVKVNFQPITPTLATTFIVGIIGQISINWKTNSIIGTNDILSITLPTNMLFDSTNNQVRLQTNSGIIFNPTIVNSQNPYSYSISTSSNGSTIVPAGSTFILSSFWPTCLIDTAPRTVFISLLRNGYQVESGSFIITPQPNNLLNVLITSNAMTVSSPMNLTITFTIANQLYINSSIRIQIPSQIGLTESTPSCTLKTDTLPSPITSSITCDLVNSTVVIPSFLTSTLPTNSNLILTISNAIVNPITTEPTSKFIISTISNNSYVVDQCDTVSYSAVYGTIEHMKIYSSSTKVVDISNYTLQYNLTRTIAVGSTILVIIPPQISVTSQASFSYSINDNTPSNIIPSNNTVGLVFSGIFADQLPIDTSIKIYFNLLTNPNSYKPTSSFQVFTQHNGFTIQSLTSSLSVAMDQMTNFNYIASAVAQYILNGQIKDYTFYITPKVPINAGDTIIITIINDQTVPYPLSFIQNIQNCVIKYLAYSFNNLCSGNQSQFRVNVSQPLDNTSTIYQLIVGFIKQSRTMSPTSNFNITTLTNNYYVQTSIALGKQNDRPNYIQSLQMQIISPLSQLNEVVQMKFIIQTFNGVNMYDGQFILIIIPKIFTYIDNSLPSLCNETSFICTLYNNTNIIKVTQSTNINYGVVQNYTITLSNNIYISPGTFDFTTDYFYVLTMDNNSNLIDTTDPVNVPQSKAIFSLTCQGKCRKCLAPHSSYCLTCYQYGEGIISNVSFDGYNILDPINNQCVDACNNGTYINDNNSTCLACIPPCENCLSENICISCVTHYYLLSTNHSCVDTCPDGTYADSNSSYCVSCVSNCYTCINSSVTCTSCTTPLYLNQNICTAACPNGTFYEKSIPQCVPCDPGCNGSCVNNISDCISCKTGYYHPNINSHQCISECPFGTVNNPSLEVCQCQGNCQTCVETLTNCLTCITDYFFYFNSCYPSCPSQTYNTTDINGMKTCEKCIVPNCSNCSSTECFNCSGLSYLYNGRCYQNCPNFTFSVPVHNTCQFCGDGCQSCYSFKNCTSCLLPYLKQETRCVPKCTSGYINFNATICVSQCPIGYFNLSGKCDNTTNPYYNISTDDGVILVHNKIIPFPCSITYVLIFVFFIFVKCLFPLTLLPSAVMSIASILEVASTVVLIIGYLASTHLINITIFLLIIAIVLIYLLNFVHLCLLFKILNNDKKFMVNYSNAPCRHLIRLISTLTYFKFHEIVFSNIFNKKLLSNKVDSIEVLFPFNILLFSSLFISVFIVALVSMISYDVQQQLLTSSIFIQSVDCTIVVILNMLPTILVLIRDQEIYEKKIKDKRGSRNDTHDHFITNGQSQVSNQFFIEQSGVIEGSSFVKAGQTKKMFGYENENSLEGSQYPLKVPYSKKKQNKINRVFQQQESNIQKKLSTFHIIDNKLNPNQIIQENNQIDNVQSIVLNASNNTNGIFAQPKKQENEQ